MYHACLFTKQGHSERGGGVYRYMFVESYNRDYDMNGCTE